MLGLTPLLRVAVLLASLTATLYMTGVIWTVQLVHYALFDHVGAAEWRSYHAAHLQRMTWVVLVPMVVDLGASALLVLEPPLGASRPWLTLGFLLAVVTWAVTFFVSIPLHNVLSTGWDPAAGRALLMTNWWRTIAWTAHALVLLVVLWRLLAAYHVFGDGRMPVP